MCLVQSVFFFKKPMNFINQSGCLRDGCPKVVAAKKSTVLWKTVQFSSEFSELRLIAPSWLQMSVKKAFAVLI